jgi:chromosome segregation ATPase
MVGKFNSKNTGVTVTKQQLANLRQRHDAALKEYQKAQEDKQNVAANLRKICQEIEDNKKKQNNFTSDMAALKAQIPLKEKNIETQKKKLSECTLSENALEEKEGNLEQEKEEFEALLEPFEEAQENATRINNKGQDLQVTQKKEITKKLDKFNEQAKKVNEELNKKIVELKNCDSNSKIRKEIGDD